MQKCQNCGKKIRYIASKDSVVICDYEEIIVYSEFGRRIEGYRLHKCAEAENERTTDRFITGRFTN